MLGVRWASGSPLALVASVYITYVNAQHMSSYEIWMYTSASSSVLSLLCTGSINQAKKMGLYPYSPKWRHEPFAKDPQGPGGFVSKLRTEKHLELSFSWRLNQRLFYLRVPYVSLGISSHFWISFLFLSIRISPCVLIKWTPGYTSLYTCTHVCVDQIIWPRAPASATVVKIPLLLIISQ